MEELLRLLSKDAQAAKFQPIRQAVQCALEVLESKEAVESVPAYLLREKCMQPLHLALESKTKRLMTHAIAGLEKMLKDDRFQSSMEPDCEDQWLPLQVMNTVYSTPNLPEEIQTDAMKLLLKMMLSTSWCTNARIVTRVSEVYIETYTSATYSCNLRGLVQAALTQLLGSYSEKLASSLKLGGHGEPDVMSDFNAKDENGLGNLLADVVSLLRFLTDKISAALKAGENKQAVPLLLEGILSVLTNAPHQLRNVTDFQELVWQSLCPTLIAVLGMPKSDSKMKPSSDPSKNMDTAHLSPTTAKIIYSISVEICKMLGPVRSLRPVLESLFHRMLMCSQPNQRHDALRAVKQLLSDPVQLLDITVTYCQDDNNTGKASKTSDLALVKLITDSIKECCHSADSALCFTCVLCVADLLTSVQKLDRGAGIHDDAVNIILNKYSSRKDEVYLGAFWRRRTMSTILDSPISSYITCGDSRMSLSERSISVTSQSSIEDGTSDSSKPVSASDGISNGLHEANSDRSQGDKNNIDSLPQGQKSNNDDRGQGDKNNLDFDSQPQGQMSNVDKKDLEGPETSKEYVVGQTEANNIPPSSYSNQTNLTSSQRSMTQIGVSRKGKRSRTPECDLDSRFLDLEKKSASLFIEELTTFIPELLDLYSITDVDEALQKFSSAYADKQSNIEKSPAPSGNINTLLNADSIYSTSYAVLSLTLRLHLNDFYTARERHLIPVSEAQFLDSVLDTDMFLYLSPDWLSHVYQTVLTTDMLAKCGCTLQDDMAFFTALRDLDGEGSQALGGQMMKGTVYYEVDESSSPELSAEHRQAGKLLACQILSTCWDGIIEVLSTLLSGKSAIGLTNSFAVMIGTEGAKEESLRKRDALCKCLDGLQTAAKLCCSLGLQDRCESVLKLLANTSCVMEDFIHATQSSNPADRVGNHKSTSLPLLPGSKPKLVTLHAAHVLSMDAMMTTGLEIGSHSAACWKQVFRCCAFISELEHTYFSAGRNQSNLPRIQQEQTSLTGTVDDSDDLYSVPSGPIVPVAPRINVASLIRQSGIESGWDRAISGTASGELNAAQASQALCGLSQEVDRLFEEAANNLNMTALTGFLSSLCEASKHQLSRMGRKTAQESVDHGGDRAKMPVNSLHLYRLQNVLMKVAHSDRPLIHIIKAWSMVSSYLVESAGHKDHSISKLAVTCVHDFIIAVMTQHTELPHFHTNEMLCKTFENILCLELCDGDIQDQIVCSICELVEASASDIQSGWRPLFGALRAVRLEYTALDSVNEARQHHIEAVLDVFDVYLNTDNILVFANATVDCILCLLKYVRGHGEFSESESDDSDSELEFVDSSPACDNLCLPALRYLTQCSVILQSMWTMPACPVFHGAKRIQVDTLNRCVDPVIGNMDFAKFTRYFIPDTPATENSGKSPVGHGPSVTLTPGQGPQMDGAGDSLSLLSSDSGILIPQSKDPDEGGESTVRHVTSLDDLDNPTGILRVWFLLLEGVSGAISQCPRNYQPNTMETLFELLRAAAHVPGPKFVVYCSKHLLLPMIQCWLRSGSRKFGYWETGATNFKQCCGHTTDLMVDLIHDFRADAEICGELNTVLTQLLWVLTECVAQPTEVISRLGCSCIRHILLSGHSDFTEAMWQTVIDGLEGALHVTTYSLRQIMLLFHAGSENFYGDIGQVKVATRKDCSMMEFVRMWHLAQQVFLLDSQVSVELPQVDNTEDRSYVFLLYPPGYENSLNPDHILARVPFRSIVVGLLSHQLLLQTLGCILLEGNTTPNCHMPGMLSQLSTKHVSQLLQCLRNSYHLACDFDQRPGLKFLVQKVAHTPVAVNLYKQAGASMVFYIHTLIKICSNIPDLTRESVREILTEKHTDNDRTNVDKRSQSDEATGKPTETGDADNGNHSEEVKNDEKSEDESENVDTTQADDDNQHDEVTQKVLSIQNKSSNSDSCKQLSEKDNIKGANSERQSFQDTACQVDKSPNMPKITDNPELYLRLLASVCEELVQTYIDILYDKAGTSCVDNMADQQLFFLIAQPDEFPELTSSRIDIKQLDAKLEQTQARLQGQTVTMQAVSVQDEGNEPPSPVKPDTVLPPLNDPETKSKRERRSENESRVYNLATDKLIKNLMTEYKKRKNQNAMPTFAKVTKNEKKQKASKKKQTTSVDPVEQVIEQQQQTSIMKDSEAHLQSWTELLCTILGLFDQLDDNRFTTLLPVIFSPVNHMICHAQDLRLREALAQWLHRIGAIFTLALPEKC